MMTLPPPLLQKIFRVPPLLSQNNWDDPLHPRRPPPPKKKKKQNKAQNEKTENERKVSFSFCELRYVLYRIQLLKKKNTNIWRIKGVAIRAVKFEAARIHFLGDVCDAVAVVVA